MPPTKIYDKTIAEAAIKHNIPVKVFRKLLEEESGLNPNAHSHYSKGKKKGQPLAFGLGQITQDTFKQYGQGDILDPVNNINTSAKILSDYYKKTGSWKDAIGSYNGGLNGWKKYKGTIMKQSPKYFTNINQTIDEYEQEQRNGRVTPEQPSVADNTNIVRSWFDDKEIKNATISNKDIANKIFNIM